MANIRFGFLIVAFVVFMVEQTAANPAQTSFHQTKTVHQSSQNVKQEGEQTPNENSNKAATPVDTSEARNAFKEQVEKQRSRLAARESEQASKVQTRLANKQNSIKNN